MCLGLEIGYELETIYFTLVTQSPHLFNRDHYTTSERGYGREKGK